MPTNPYAPPTVGDEDTGARTSASHMTAAAMKQGVKNALICAVPFACVWLMVQWLVSTMTNWSPMIVGMYGAVLIVLGCAIAMLVGSFSERQRRGDLLMDCGSHPGKLLFVLNAVLFFAMGCAGIFQADMFGRGGGLFGIAFSLYWVYMATTRLAIYEGGIWTYTDLIQWENIHAAKWQGGNTLIFETRRKFKFLGRGALAVPKDRVDEFRELFEKHAPLETKSVSSAE